MLVTSAPIAIPVNTANPPTESVAAEAAQKPTIPAPKPSSESAANKPTQENPPDNRTQTGQPRIDGESRQRQSGEQETGAGSEEQRQQQRQQQAEIAEIQKLRARDREVRAHETAHAAAGGQLTGAPQLDFTIGPDGKRYAVSGEVSIDTAKVPGDPQATIRKMQQVRRAALAPARPSGQDLAVAARAAQIANQARVEAQLEGQDTIEKNPEDRERIVFTSPVAVRRASLQLAEKIRASGAFEPLEDTHAIELRV